MDLSKPIRRRLRSDASENNRKYREFEAERNQAERKFNDKVGEQLRSLFAENLRKLRSAKGCYTG